MTRRAAGGLLLALCAALPGCGGGDSDGLPPSITQQPAAQDVAAGGTATFSVGASGAAPIAFQWQYATSANSATWTDVYSGGATYTITNVGTTLNGRYYRAVAVNLFGTAVSNAVLLTVH